MAVSIHYGNLRWGFAVHAASALSSKLFDTMPVGDEVLINPGKMRPAPNA